MTAIILVFSTAIVCVACKGAKTVKLDKKMDAGEIMSALVKTDIKNFTVVTTSKEEGSEGYVTKEYYTQSGYGIVSEKNGERKRSSVQFFEGNRYYDLTKYSGQNTEKYVCSIGDNEIVKGSIDRVKGFLSELIAILYSIKECGGKSYLSNWYEGASVYVEDKNGFVIETKSQKIVYKDFNKTKLNVDDFEDYKNYDATIPIGMYEESEDGTYYEFWDILKYIGPYEPILLQLKSYTIQSEFTKDGKTLPVKAIMKFSGYRVSKYIIPTSIEKVSFSNASPYTEYCYLGTKADWESKVTVETYPYADIVVKCSDGEVTVKKQATENP